jgi:hypothetical protein
MHRASHESRRTKSSEMQDSLTVPICILLVDLVHHVRARALKG